ncbi:MAG: hypothetical protein ACD_12C00116G0008 [uncultured bacterium]|nr:MAG: hypothetical protein ACD_12C00116G0008 [uncultured bacterium]
MKFPFFSTKANKEYYLGIFLKESQGIIMIFLKENGRLELIDREKFNYTNGWENLTNDVDEALYKLEKNLDLEIKNTIVFVYSHLVDEKIGDIKPVYLHKIKQLTKALDLKPMGYIECFEAISFYLQKEDQGSLTAILIEIDQTQVGIFTYTGGKIDSKKILGRTDNIIADLTEGFEEIRKKSILPARIIIYDSGNLDDTATKILSHRWSSNYFIQIPKVDIISEDEVINSLMNIFGEQIKNEASSEAFPFGQHSEDKSKNKKENFGFMINEDIGEKALYQKENILPQTDWKNKFKKSTDKFINFFRVKSRPGNFKMNFSGKIFMVAGILIITLGLFINEYFFHQAELTLYLPTQSLEKNIKLELDYRESSSSANFSESTTTSGKQEVGDKARGTVTIHNFDDKEKIFAKGSTLQASKLQFLLDTDIKVASSSLTADGSAKLPGKSSGAVTAGQIGVESNLSKSQRFSFDGLSSSVYFAVNESAFTGGSKKQIQTVSKKDQDDLKTSVINKAKKEIPSIKVLPDEVIASSLSKVDFDKLSFSKEIGEESEKLTLQGTVNTTQYLYNKKLFLDKVLVMILPEVKGDYKLEKQNISYTINKIIKEENILNIDAKIKASAVIKISDEDIKKSLLGKNESKIKEILKTQYKIDGYNLNIKESLPFFKNVLPFFSKNIILKNSSL